MRTWPTFKVMFSQYERVFDLIFWGECCYTWETLLLCEQHAPVLCGQQDFCANRCHPEVLLYPSTVHMSDAACNGNRRICRTPHLTAAQCCADSVQSQTIVKYECKCQWAKQMQSDNSTKMLKLSNHQSQPHSMPVRVLLLLRHAQGTPHHTYMHQSQGSRNIDICIIHARIRIKHHG